MRMRRILTVLVVVLLLVGVLASTGTARQRGWGTFEVKVIPNVETEVIYDWGWTMLEELTSMDGEHLGHSGGVCFNLSGDPEVFEEFVCDFGMRFPHGDITVNGAINMNEWLEGDTVMPVTGGTGKFRHIRGQVSIIPAEDFSYSTLVFKVRGTWIRY